MNDMDMIFLYKDYLGEIDLSFLEGTDKKDQTLILTGNQCEVQGETLVIKEKKEVR